MNKIDQFADYLSRNEAAAASFMESLSLIQDAFVQRTLKKHVKVSHSFDGQQPWKKILHDIYSGLVSREELRKESHEELKERRKAGKKIGFWDRLLEHVADTDINFTLKI